MDQPALDRVIDNRDQERRIYLNSIDVRFAMGWLHWVKNGGMAA